MSSNHHDLADPYGSDASELLRLLRSTHVEIIPNLSNRLYETLGHMDTTARVLAWLDLKEFEHLRRRQVQHITMLLSDELTEDAHRAEAVMAGEAHALVGVPTLWLVEAYRFIQDDLYRCVFPRIDGPLLRERFMRIVSQRSLLDLQYQESSHRRLDAENTAVFETLDQYVTSTGNVTDLVRGALKIIGSLPGGVSLFFARVDAHGEFQIEQSYGAAADEYHRAIEAGKVPKISIDPNVAAGNGPGGRAWRSGDIVVSDAWALEPEMAPWRDVGEALGFRSSAAVPLLDESGRSIALLSLYSAWPGFFSTNRSRGFFRHAQRVLSQALQQTMSAAVIPMREQQAYRQMLREEKIVLHYQPIIDLTDGHLIKLEALARMRSNEGQLISPQRFLSTLGGDELLDLFEQGLRQVCEAWRTLHAEGIDTKIAINFPAEGFDDSRYEDSLFRVVDEGALPANRLQLEVLETHDTGIITDTRKVFIEHLREAGIEIAEDDLGSGHSSLLRLDQYSFDEVKIDQGLVRSVMHKPKRAVEFILYLTRLAHAFNIPVTVEGLENDGMIEAAAVLGADRGQGYGIAKPMPLKELPAWYRSFEYSIDPSKPRTAIGALAGYLLWDMQLDTISERPELAAGFMGARALVEEFIVANDLLGGDIDELLRRNQELAAGEPDPGDAASSVREQLIAQLTERWLAEAGGT